MRRFSFLFVIFAFSAIFTFGQNVTQGSLYASGKTGVLGECPLKNTNVKADISGFLARVTVTQQFENSFSEPIEAVYSFPLSQNSAVDEMIMKIGERTIRGRIMKREEARQVYEQAKTDGKTASLLDQQRPNIFTQSVANILPGDQIEIEISYVETLKYEDGQYEFVFPMTIGPRYNPGSMNPADKQNISPEIAETRSGNDISIEVKLDAGIPTDGIYSSSHPITMTNFSSNSAKISLRDDTVIPNKDFILRYDVTGKKIEDALLTHKTEKGGFFSLILSPPDKFTTGNITPKEIVFVLDTSGSMSGFPIEKAKEAMRLSLEGLNPQDTFNLITFAGDTSILFDGPVPATPDNLARAKAFLESRRGNGGTEMMKAIKAALEPTDSKTHLRVVCFMTDGYVGNEAEIIAEIQKHPKARIFSFGIGNSVNRFLLDKMAQEGRGEVEYVGLKDDGEKAAKRFFERVRTPILTDISIDWKGLPVEDVYPARIGDLFSAKPVVLNGRYKKGASGTIRLSGYVAGKLLVRDISIKLPENEPDHDVLATLWARQRVDALMSDFYKNAKDEKARKEIQDQITSLGIEFGILTQFTSFVAVEDQIVNQNGKPTKVEVPVKMPEGVTNGSTREQDTPFRRLEIITNLQRPPQVTYSDGRSSGNGQGAGMGAESGDISSEREEKKAFNALRTDDTSGSQNGFVIDGQEITNATGGALTNIFKRVEDHQKALKTLGADMAVTKFKAQTGETDVKQAAIKFMPQGNDYLLRIDSTIPAPENFSIIRNLYFLYLPDEKTASTGTISDAQKNEFLVFSNFSFNKLKETYNLKYLGEDKINGTIPAWHLELTPKTQSNYKTIELWINGDGMVIQTKALETNGNWKSILLTNLQKNLPITMTDFRITLPKDVKVVKN